MNLRERIKRWNDASNRENALIKKNVPWIDTIMFGAAALMVIALITILILGSEKAMEISGFGMFTGFVTGVGLTLVYVRAYILKVWGASQ